MKTHENEETTTTKPRPEGQADFEKQAAELFPDSHEARQAYVRTRCRNAGIAPKVLH